MARPPEASVAPITRRRFVRDTAVAAVALPGASLGDARLAALKKIYDRDDVLRSNQNIRPA